MKKAKRKIISARLFAAFIETLNDHSSHSRNYGKTRQRTPGTSERQYEGN